MNRRVELPLLYIAIATLIFGALLQWLSQEKLAEILWFVGGVSALVPAMYWVLISLKLKQPGADILAVFSLVGTLGTRNFLAAAIISLMLSTGRVLERWAEGQAERQLKSLIGRVPKISHSFSADGSLIDIEVEEIRAGDRLLIKSGEIVPVDGKTLTDALLDESALTGEPLPVSRTIGSAICSGVLNAGSTFEMSAEDSAATSTYAGIIRLVEQAQSLTAPAVRLANLWAMRFIPIALIMSTGTFILTRDLSRTVAVLVTATPCPLILAVPIAVVSGMSRAAKLGIVVKGGAILELLSQAEVVMFDKTGTLTHGGPVVSSVFCDDSNTPEKVLQIAASIDQYSNHVIAKAILSEAKLRNLDFVEALEIREEHGIGISGKIAGNTYFIGQFEQMPSWLPYSFPLMVGVIENGALVGIIGLADPVRREARSLMTALDQVQVKRTLLVTGDRLESANLVAHEVGISEVFASMSSQGKLDLVEEAKRSTQGSVIFIGDGINDAPALAAASVGIAMGARGASAASESADVVIVEDSISKLVTAIQIAQVSHQKSLQAALLGMGLSLLAMFASSLGYLTSAVGAGVQEVIDLLAIGWALTTLWENHPNQP